MVPTFSVVGTRTRPPSADQLLDEIEAGLAVVQAAVDMGAR